MYTEETKREYEGTIVISTEEGRVAQGLVGGVISRGGCCYDKVLAPLIIKQAH